MKLERFPCVCGDVPAATGGFAAAGTFSPRMRGCSRERLHIGRHRDVFPAYAGMFR